MGTVFDIQRFSIHDGPGIRTTVFFKGCPLRCLWCHNPESQNTRPELMFFADKCVSCGECAKVCGNTFTEKCTGCGKCVSVCRHGAREKSGYAISADEVVSKVLRDKAFYKTSGGGVTLSGGEPLMQSDFALEILLKCRENGIGTAIETCGFAKTETLGKLLPYLDHVYFDIKGIDPAKHKENTGVSNEIILENARFLMARDTDVTFRMPLIPGYNDSERKAVEEFVGGHKFEIMPYHDYGVAKYGRLGREYLVETKVGDK